MSWLEGIFSRGDRRLSRVVMEAWERGARFDAWGEHFDLDVWRRALDAVGTDPAFYLHRERDPDEVLPWDHISSGVTKTFLKKEWRRAQEAKPTADCRQHCLECGVCDHEEIDPVLFGDRRGSLPARKSAPTSSPGPSVKWRLTFTKRGPARYLGHLELVRVFLRTFKRAGLELVHSKGFHPTPRVSFACALPVGTESLEETLILELKGPARRKALMARINGELPPGLSVTDAEEVPLENTKMRLRESHFHIAANGVRLDERRLSRFLDSPRFPLTKVTRKGEKEIDARTLVKSIRLTSHRTLELVVTHRAGPELKPSDIVRGVFSLDENEAGKLKILKTRQILA
jgi:radical SAM-linked protein